MFGKISHHQVAHHFSKAKQLLGSAYHQTKNFLGNVDHGIRTFKHIYGAVAPVLESYGVNPANKHVMKALTGYDNIRNSVMENHDKVLNDINTVKHELSNKKQINLDFA